MPSHTLHTTTSVYSEAIGTSLANSFRPPEGRDAGARTSTTSLSGVSHLGNMPGQASTYGRSSSIGQQVDDMYTRTSTKDLLTKMTAMGDGPDVGPRDNRWASPMAEQATASAGNASESFRASAASLQQRLQQQQQQAARLQAMLRTSGPASPGTTGARSAAATSAGIAGINVTGAGSPSAAPIRSQANSYGFHTSYQYANGSALQRDRVSPSLAQSLISDRVRAASPSRGLGYGLDSAIPASATFRHAAVGQANMGSYPARPASAGRAYMAGASLGVGSLGLGLGLGTADPPRGLWGPQGGGMSAYDDMGPRQPPRQQQEEERLRLWVQELRHERRRLEDKLLLGDPQGMRALDMRDDLEAQVLGLTRQRDALHSEIMSIATLQQAVQEMSSEVEGLRHALRAEAEKQVAQEAARISLETALSDIRSQLELLQQQHTHAVEELNRESNVVTVKYRRAAQRLSAAEEGADKLRTELQATRQELAAKDAALVEIRASSEALQVANAQLQGHLTASSRDAEGRALELQRALEEQRDECARLQATVTGMQRTASTAEATAKEAVARGEFLRGEREKLLKLLAAEQAASASARQSVEALQGQLRAAEGQRVDLDHNARIQLEALQKQYDTQATTSNKQHDLTVVALEKQYASLQRQYEAASASHDKLLALHNALRKERDDLWAEVEAAKSAAAGLQHERDDASARLTALRAEVKQSMDDVVQDREQRLAAMALQHDHSIRELTAQFETRTAELQRDGDAKLRAALELAEQLRAELAEAQASGDKYKGAVVHLKEQLKEALLNRDEVLRELEAERDFSRELNRLINQIRGTDGP